MARGGPTARFADPGLAGPSTALPKELKLAETSQAAKAEGDEKPQALPSLTEEGGTELPSNVTQLYQTALDISKQEDAGLPTNPQADIADQ